MTVGIPICFQCGTGSNPCRCKVVGPTLGFLAFVAAAIVEWPVGALVYCFKHVKGRRIMGHPASVVYPKAIELQEDLTFMQVSVKILDRKEQVLCNKVILLIQILWRNKDVKEVTWEHEARMKKECP